MKRPVYLLLLCVLVSSMLMLYGNCSPSHTSTESSSLNLSVSCGDMKGLFEQTYRPFLQTTCNSCHIQGGQGKGTFADNNLESAWAAFQFAGYSKISTFATNPSHNPPFTGTHNSARVERYKEAWITALEEKERCAPGGSGYEEETQIGPRLNTIAKSINLTNIGQSRVIEWNLSTELRADPGLSLPNVPGAIVSIKVELAEVLGQTSYFISEPRLRNSTVDISLKSLRTKINGNYIPGETTFNFVEREIYNQTNTLLSAGTLVALGQNRASDTLALSFEKIEVVSLPPPDLGPEVSFSLASLTRTESGFVDAEVQLSRAPSRSVIVQIDLATGSTAKGRRSPRSTTQPYDFFDWDVTFGTVADPANLVTLTFIPGAPLTQTVRLLISDDQRDEPNEIAILNLSNVENGTFGTHRQLRLTITDDDPPPANPFIKSFSQLMTQNGILNRRCIECHNTVLKEGGYDMTDYTSMISSAKRILVPGQPTESEMYKRLRLSGPGRMPLDQALDPADQRDIENWILDGAKNN